MNEDCRFSRYLNLTIGLILMGMGGVLVLIGATILPLLGFYLAIPALIGSLIFLFAPRDGSCFIPDSAP
jgi:hypothetical protein